MASLLRTLVKFERWKELVDPKTFPWRDQLSGKMNRYYAETRGYLGLGQTDRADEAHRKFLAPEFDKTKTSTGVYAIMKLEPKSSSNTRSATTIRRSTRNCSTCRSAGPISKTRVRRLRPRRSRRANRRGPRV